MRRRYKGHLGFFRRAIRYLRLVGWRTFLVRVEREIIALIFPVAERVGLHITPVHYYSPIPDTGELKRTRKKWYIPSKMPGVCINPPSQEKLLLELLPFLSWLPDGEKQFGQGYGFIESIVLHAFIHRFRPSRVIEIGGGDSTAVSLCALRENRHGVMTCVEPYPTNALRALLAESGELIESRVENLPVQFFDKLGTDDILFIDSSHYARLGGDVPYLYLEVLPRLRSGVIVHVHDIYFPYPCPRPEEFIFEQHAFWSEQFLLQALLCENENFETMLCLSGIHYLDPELLRRYVPCYDPALNCPSSIWIRRTP